MVTITKTIIMTKNPITAVEIITTKLLCTGLTAVGISVGVIAVSLKLNIYINVRGNDYHIIE